MSTIPNSRSRSPSSLLALSAAALFALAPIAAQADSDKHYKHGREYKEKYWDGACKVERKWKSNGSYQEKRKCRDDYRYGYGPEPVMVPVVPAPAPAIVINPPPIIIRP